MVGSSVLQFFKLQSPEWTILEEFITVTRRPGRVDSNPWQTTFTKKKKYVK